MVTGAESFFQTPHHVLLKLSDVQRCSEKTRFKDLVFFVQLHSFALKTNSAWAILRKTMRSSLLISTQAICIIAFVQEGMKK